jgi:hypothetical protein
MSTALFLPRYFELMRTAADAGLADSHSDQSLKNRSPKQRFRTASWRSALMALMAASVAKSLPAIHSIVSLPFCRDPAKGKRPPRRTEAGDMTSR